jgi:acyl-CoA thioesterase FadM
MQLYEGFRLANATVLKYPDFWRIAHDGLLWFMIASNFKFEERFFQLHRKRAIVPVTLKATTGKIGQTSFVLQIDLMDVDGKNKIMATDFSSCLVDRNSRKPKVLPDWFRNILKKCQTDSETKRFTPLEPPSGAFSYQNTLWPSDLDYNGHVNQAMYGRLMIDCAVEASLSGYYKQYKGDFAEFVLNDVNCIYLAELNCGDEVVTKTWEDEVDNKVLYFSMKNAKNNATAFWGRLTTHGHQDDIVC